MQESASSCRTCLEVAGLCGRGQKCPSGVSEPARSSCLFPASPASPLHSMGTRPLPWSFPGKGTHSPPMPARQKLQGPRAAGSMGGAPGRAGPRTLPRPHIPTTCRQPPSPTGPAAHQWAGGWGSICLGRPKIGLAWLCPLLLGPQAGPSPSLGYIEVVGQGPSGSSELGRWLPTRVQTHTPQMGWGWVVSPCTRPSSQSHPDTGQARGGGHILHKHHAGEASRNQKHMARPAQCPRIPASRPRAAHPQSRARAGSTRPSCPHPPVCTRTRHPGSAPAPPSSVRVLPPL